ncbi:MAG: hypothetical protein A2Y04_00755 [Omnitrophica WOR_2 bacterium GWC2_45_7]|nr:MAG: hypothetical protein A2Z81_03550 [Omnitrophica WOR_2 bacterium GWA2_45_18]OGX18428.1 MAG: hypothetical protein A2Y04_00755 [Omnitrophica WOR_2 bacterium GWC2_45_7]
MLILILFFIFCTVAMVSYVGVPELTNRLALANEKRQQKYSNKLEQILSKQEVRKVSRLFLLMPLAAAAVGYVLLPEEMKLVGAGAGIAFGIIFPGIFIKFLIRKTKDKFADQLIDALLIMSSSFRGGLSLIQSLEAVVEEMPEPISKEFAIVLGENKMGVSIEEALYHLYNRLPSLALQQMITAILLARETGGNLPAIFNRIVTNIREARKIQQNLNTLTLQGKIQGVVMSLLPIAFGFIVYSTNRRVFDHMLNSEVGRAMLTYAVFSELIGVFLIWKISTLKEY